MFKEGLNKIQELIEKDERIKFLSYVFVGGVATLVEWGLVWLLNGVFLLQYLLATALAFIASTYSNWVLGRLLTFSSADKKVNNEVMKIYIASAVGLLMNLGIMWLLVDKAHIAVMLSKMIATAIVFSYNYLIRRFFIYRKNG